MSKLMTILFALAAGAAGLTAAQQPAGTATPTAPIKRILLQRFDVPNSNFETASPSLRPASTSDATRTPASRAATSWMACLRCSSRGSRR